MCRGFRTVPHLLQPEKTTRVRASQILTRQQADGEPFDKWLMELRVIARNFDFGDNCDRQLRDKIHFGIRDDVAR